MKERLCRTKKETEEFAKALAKELRAGDVVCLHGDLGAGKTQLMQWMAPVWGISSTVDSPTFSLVQTYPTRDENLHIHHLDLYRLEEEEELETIGFEDLFYPVQAITFNEWPQRAASYLPKQALHVFIDRVDEEGEHARYIHWGTTEEMQEA